MKWNIFEIFTDTNMKHLENSMDTRDVIPL
jgi:hypothetical protein